MKSIIIKFTKSKTRPVMVIVRGLNYKQLNSTQTFKSHAAAIKNINATAKVWGCPQSRLVEMINDLTIPKKPKVSK